ncbi:phage holin family protein [Loigolactobacillus backii]|uniref:phage holin family protein n=1 Tax=Loigolactobacillus backii TaxID=375175 RepID=UPI0022FD70C1|nr:phage holin family protein [Loigolactobacillus backii]MDA5386944.1 phage holin family protein [Loigolactobacillus backii]MDA5389482.1 phage holin family protein [Loigolactobacillus backii]
MNELWNAINNLLSAVNNSLILMIAVGCFLATWAIKQTKIDNRWMPLVSAAVGIVIGGIAAGVMVSNIGLGAFDGFIAGLLAAGGYDAVKGFIKEVN